MRRQTPSSLDVLADALGVFLFAVRKSWGKLLAVLLPLEIIFVLSSRLLCDGDALSFESVRFVRLAGRLYALLMVVGIGFLAWSLMIGYDHLQKARAEREKQQEVWDGMEASLEQKPKARFFCRSRSSSPRANRVGAIVCYNTHDDSLSREQL